MSTVKTDPEMNWKKLVVDLTGAEFQLVLDALQSHANQIEDIANEYPGGSFIRERMNAETARSKSLIRVIHNAWYNPN